MPDTFPEPFTMIGNGVIHCGDSLAILPTLPADDFQVMIADPPYFRVLEDEHWDNAWNSEEDYLAWTKAWAVECRRLLRPDGLLFVFGQLGKREHIWLHTCSLLAGVLAFHDMIIWDRAVGYNERRDSFTPQYEMILVLRKDTAAKPYFNKDAVRLPYSEETIRFYLRDKRYKDLVAREEHLRRGKFATNILRVPSLKGITKEKAGHPTQKPEALIEMLISASSRPGDRVLDPFLGSGTSAVVAEKLGRRWLGVELHQPYAAMAHERMLRTVQIQKDQNSANHLV